MKPAKPHLREKPKKKPEPVSGPSGTLDVQTALQHGMSHHQAGRFKQAESYYQQILGTQPDHAEANHLMGLMAHKLGNNEVAVKLISKAVRKTPNIAHYHYNLGNVLHAQRSLDEAVTSYRRAIEIAPGVAEMHLNLGNALQDQGKWDDAIQCFKKAFEVKPDFALAHYNLGNAFIALGRFEDAVESLRKALEIDPNYPQYHLNLGHALKNLGRLNDAESCFLDAISIDPTYAEAHSNLGHTLYEQDRLEEALLAFRQALEHDPANATAQHMVSAINGDTTEMAPRGYVQKLFNDFAPGFEKQLVEDLGYKVPSLMRQAVDKKLGDGGVFGRALDLGCGTGLVAEKFRDIVGEFHGVDLSQWMIELAKEKGCYDGLFIEDVLEFLENPHNAAAQYDLILAADLFVYIGNLAPVFAAVRRNLTVGGSFVFSVERLEQGFYRLLDTGRYSHGETYIRGLASEYSFSVELRDQTPIRKDKEGSWVPGILFLLQTVDFPQVD